MSHISQSFPMLYRSTKNETRSGGLKNAAIVNEKLDGYTSYPISIQYSLIINLNVTDNFI